MGRVCNICNNIGWIMHNMLKGFPNCLEQTNRYMGRESQVFCRSIVPLRSGFWPLIDMGCA